MKKIAIFMLIFGLCVGVHGIVSLFCQNPFFDYLIEGAIVAVLICGMHRYARKNQPSPSQCVKTLCPIVYHNRERNYLYSLPYLDLLRIVDVWGVEVAGTIKISKNEAEPGTCEHAKLMVKENKSERIFLRLPDVIEMLIIGYNIRRINLTIRALQLNNVKADEFTFGQYVCIGLGLFGKIVPKVIDPRAGSLSKILHSYHKPSDSKEVYFVRFVV